MLPLDLGRTRQAVPLVCPDCGGAISVHLEGDDRYLVFACRVGHAYSATSLTAGMEERLEEALWSAVYLTEELAELLGDLVARGAQNGGQPRWATAARRVEQLRGNAKQLRALIHDDEPVDLGCAPRPFEGAA
jgi:two-component system chemotaxis response regulator CheB